MRKIFWALLLNSAVVLHASSEIQDEIENSIVKATHHLTEKLLTVMEEDKDVLISPMSILRVIYGDYLSCIGEEGKDELLKWANLEQIALEEVQDTLDKMLSQQKKAFQSFSYMITKEIPKETLSLPKKTKRLFMHSNIEEQINQIAFQKTKGFLQKPFSPGDLYEKNLMAVLTNILFFEGKWNHPFDCISKREIYISSKKITSAKVMYRRSRETVFSDKNGTWLFFPFKEEAKSFTEIVYVPHHIATKKELISAAPHLYEVFQKYQAGEKREQPIELWYPMISASKKYPNMLELLQKTKMPLYYALSDAFDREVVLSKLLQVCKLEEGPEGMKAAAITAGGLVATSIDPFLQKIDCCKPVIKFLVGPKGEILFAHTAGITDEFFVND